MVSGHKLSLAVLLTCFLRFLLPQFPTIWPHWYFLAGVLLISILLIYYQTPILELQSSAEVPGTSALLGQTFPNYGINPSCHTHLSVLSAPRGRSYCHFLLSLPSQWVDCFWSLLVGHFWVFFGIREANSCCLCDHSSTAGSTSWGPLLVEFSFASECGFRGHGPIILASFYIFDRLG